MVTGLDTQLYLLQSTGVEQVSELFLCFCALKKRGTQIHREWHTLLNRQVMY